MLKIFAELSPAAQEVAIDQYISFVGITVAGYRPDYVGDVTRAEVREALIDQNNRSTDWLFHEDGTIERDDTLY